jgi:hypothetical protein
VSHRIRHLTILHSAVFLINSCSHLVTATDHSLESKSHHHSQRTFSRSYGTILPSSFTRVLSSALVFSTRPPVSVWSTIPYNLKLRGFSWKYGIIYFITVVTRHHVSTFTLKWNTRIYLSTQPTHLNMDNHRHARLAFSVPPSQL